MTDHRVRRAVFPVAGLGTRFLPATKVMPKEMLTVVDKPLIHHAVEEAAAAGIEEFILVNGRGKGVLEDHFDRAFELDWTLETRGKEEGLERSRALVPPAGNVVSVRQQAPLGLGHAVWCARHAVGDEPFAVFLCDDLVLSDQPCIGELLEVHAETGGNVVAVEEVPRDQTNRYGILDIGDDDGRLVDVRGLVEKPDPADAPSNLSIIGRYVLLPEIMDHLATQEPKAGNEIQLTDAMAKMIGNAPFHGLRFSGRRFDCGSKLGFIQANIAFGLADADIGPALDKFLKEDTTS
ncbi:MAG: UTP--glucose-1-phosphate uridylyltransferase [Pseudomonadota bacterium]